MSRPVIFDTDMEFGLPGARIDSGLALLYLLGRKDIDIKGITLTGCAGSIIKSRDAVSWILRLNSRTDIPIFDGCSKQGEYTTNASSFISETAKELREKLTLITTGALSNIYGAALLDNNFYSHPKNIICSGGLIHPLQVPDWKSKKDTAFSLDPCAAEYVLNEAQNLVLMNMHIGTQALINIEDLLAIKEYNIQLYYLVKEYLLSEKCRNTNGRSALYLWSILPAVYMENRELFHDVNCRIDAKRKSLKKGILKLSETGNIINMPDNITDIDKFYSKIHRGLELCPFRRWSN